tara:strand:+ start:41 stop:826 length:786 start_codon:yes stop_codon:yes gene_type:complete
MAEGILTLNPITPERDPDQLGGPGYIEAPLGAGIGLALANMLKDKNKENLPEEVDEEKTPQEEPPKDPNVLPELLAETAVDKVKNKIKTWDKYFDSKEEAEKAAIDAGGTLKEFEEGVIQKQITFRKHSYGYDVLFDKKRVGELLDITQDLKDFGTQVGNKKTFNLVFIDEDGSNQRDAITTIDGLNFAKERTKELVSRDLLRDTTEPLYPSLKDIFQNLKYNKKGDPKGSPLDLAEELEKNKKAKGGMIDSPLPGGNRYI